MKKTSSNQKLMLKLQQDEINGHHVYKRLACSVADQKNSKILSKIAEDEYNHYLYWEEKTKKKLKPSRITIWFYFLAAKIFGLTFGIRWLERNEHDAINIYEKLKHQFPDLKGITEDEKRHEDLLIDMFNEDFLNYVGSIVLGLSDALVELTGALAGFTFALQNTSVIALAGLITGISAALSMGASEFLSVSEETEGNPLKAATYTGVAYLLTVLILITPYILLQGTEALIPLAISLTLAVIVIMVYTFYISVAKGLPFKRRFLKISGISLGVAFLSLLIGLGVRVMFNIEI
ncbi:MAG: VIT1/CCC1 transporter family protein [Candidatus Hodarchaeales archaeon]